MKKLLLSVSLSLLFLFSEAQITIRLNAAGKSYEILNSGGGLETFGPLNSLMGGYNASSGALTLYTVSNHQQVIGDRLYRDIIDGSTGLAFPDLATLKTFVATNFFAIVGSSDALPAGSPNQVMGFGTDTKPVAKDFNAAMYAPVPSGVPTGTVLLAKANTDGTLGYANATKATDAGTIAIRNDNGTLSVANGVNPTDATNKLQWDEIVTGINNINLDIQSINQNAAGKSLNNIFRGTNTFTKAITVDTINHVNNGNATVVTFVTPTATNSIVIPNKSMTLSGLDDVAELDNRSVHITGTQTITGAKSFTWPVSIIEGANLSISNEAGTASTEYGSASTNYIVGSFATTLGFVTPTKNNNLLAPNKGGTLATLDDISSGGGSPQVIISGSTTGTMICSMPSTDVNYKKVLINLNGMIGTATYVFPTAFRVGPDVSLMKSNQQISISSLTNTQVVIDNANQQGFLEIIGY